MPDRAIRAWSITGLSSVIDIQEDVAFGHLWVRHDGTITFDELMAIKCEVWGDEARAIEVYPPRSQLVDSAPIRHLFRLGKYDFAPDLLAANGIRDTLEARFNSAWAEACEVGS